MTRNAPPGRSAPSTAAALDLAVKPAPSADAAAIAALPIDRSVVQYQTGADGALWARGANYKLRMDGSGTSYVPFLSSGAPKNFDVHFALDSVTVAGEPLPFDGTVEPVRAGDEVRFDRGFIDELYRIAPRELEQQFVIESLPKRGEIVVRVDAASELAASTVSDGFEFANDFGRVHYGRATAIDAAGVRMELESELDAGAITIRVPADFVGAAKLPLLIDPVVVAFGVETSPRNSLQPDVSHATGGYLLHTWEESFSWLDHDVYAVISDGAGNFGWGSYVDFTGDYWARPRSAHLGAGDRFLVAAEVGLPLFGGRRIWGVVRDVTLGYVTSPFQISDAASNTDKTNVDVGGDPYPFAPSYFCVVYESAWSGSDHDMLACMVDHNGVRYGGTVVVDNTSGTFDSEPAISKTNDASTWNMVWQRQVSAGDRDVYGARIAWNGVVTSHTFPIRTTWGFDESHPAVSGSLQGTQRYLVAYEGNYGDHDILLCMLDGTTPVVSDFDLSLAEGSHFLRNQIEPCVESNGRHFACSYAEQFSTSATDYDVYTVELLPVGASLLLNEPHTPLGVSTAPDRSPQIVCHESGDNNTATTVWWTIWNIQASVWGSGNSDEEAVAGFAGTNGGPITSFCGAGSSAQCPCGNTGSSGKGCGNSYDAAGGTLTASGSASTAADTLSMTFGGLPPFKSALLFQSPNVILSGFGSVFGDGVRCVSSPAFRFPIRNTNASGSAGFGPAYGDAAFSVVGGIPSFGGTYHYQVWYRDTADFCTGDFTNFTNALRVTWTP